jgi:hypothetical protein
VASNSLATLSALPKRLLRLCRTSADFSISIDHPEAALPSLQFFLGQGYQFGAPGVLEKDPKKAIHWLEEAKKSGHPDAEAQLLSCKRKMSPFLHRLIAHPLLLLALFVLLHALYSLSQFSKNI